MSKSKKLELGARHAEVVQSAIQHWLDTQLLSESEATQLADSITIRTFDWEKFAKYTLRLAIICLVIAVSSVVLEASFIRIYRRIVALPAWLRGAITALMAVGVHLFAYDRSVKFQRQKYANEGIHAIGALLFALAALQVIEQLNESYHQRVKSAQGSEEQSEAEKEDEEVARQRRIKEDRERSRLIGNAIWAVTLGLAAVYATVALLSRSTLIWTCAIMVTSFCIGGSGGYFGGGYWIDMESPFLFIGFGSFLLSAAKLMQSHPITQPLWSTTRVWGLIYTFISLWILSIWGYDDYFESTTNRAFLTRKIRMFLWSVVFFVVAGVSVWHGLRFDDSTTKGFGLTFLGINLYTKYFECFWRYSKAAFFAILAGSFAVIGKYAENVWNMQLEALQLG